MFGPVLDLTLTKQIMILMWFFLLYQLDFRIFDIVIYFLSMSDLLASMDALNGNQLLHQF